MPDFPLRIDAPAQVSIFAYDNSTVVLESFRPESSAVAISAGGENLRLRDLVTGERIEAVRAAAVPAADTSAHTRRLTQSPRTMFNVSLSAHSFRAYRLEK